MCNNSKTSPELKIPKKSKSMRSVKKIGNGHLVTQVGFDDRDGHASEARLRVSVDVEVEELTIS